MLTQQINAKLGKPPCYKCPDREPGCHGRCEKYQEWKIKYNCASKELSQSMKDEATSFLVDNTRKRKQKWRKQHDNETV